MCMHWNNPKGVKCTNTLCTSLPRANNHNIAYCYWPGGGMESKAPASIHNKCQKSETATVAMATPSDPASLSTPSNMSTSKYGHQLLMRAPPQSFIENYIRC